MPKLALDADVGFSRAVDPDDGGAEIGEQHGGHRSGADPGEFDDSDAFERAAAFRRHSSFRLSGRIAAAQRSVSRSMNSLNLAGDSSTSGAEALSASICW